ncbi:hypothetical protein F485_gp239 [Aeromonas phage CC2]|uniref:Uncharacterized protein n=1 Tax=Aeromonas phage CC2 TaxID=1204516 RepID=I6XGK5_9CAUD|nr:hypothetical protein F485_gp239 [Aeromonas phage CC2]AFN39196.1 hypothetical protein CC2_056 [Aeromonas phage CC2]
MKKIMEALGYTWFETRSDFVATIGQWEESYTCYEETDFPCWLKMVDSIDSPYNAKTIMIYDRVSESLVGEIKFEKL